MSDASTPSESVSRPPNVPPLRTFYLYLSAGCNLHCRHCWITPTFVQGKPVPAECVSLDLLRAAVAEAKPLGLSAVKLTGGEPLLHPEFRKVVELLVGEGLSLTIETNGTLIDRDMAAFFSVVAKMRHVAISLDSPIAEEHDRFRGKQGAFAAAVAGFGHLVSTGMRPQIIMSVYRGNLNRVDDLVELAHQMKAGSVKFNPVTNSGRGADLHKQGQGLDFDELSALIHYIRGPLQDRYPKLHLSAMLPPALTTAKELLRHSGKGEGCHVRGILGILGTGEMALCGIGRNVPELCFGKLGRDSLREVWCNHPVLVQLRNDLNGPFTGTCGDCLHAGTCLTHCVAINFEANGKLVSPSPFCNEAERRGVFPATRRKFWKAPALPTRTRGNDAR